MRFIIKMLLYIAVSGLIVLLTDFTLPLMWIKAYIHTHAYTLILLSIVPTFQFTVAIVYIYLRGWWKMATSSHLPISDDQCACLVDTDLAHEYYK